MSDDFNPIEWAKKMKANSDRAEANSLMDSGWSEAVARDCTTTCSTLLWKIVKELQQVEIDPRDFFDRPRLAAILAAVQELRA